MEAAIATGDGGEMRFALRLEHLHPDRKLDAENVHRDAVAFLMTLEGQTDASFTIQTVATPDTASPERGRLEIHLVVTLRGEPRALPSPERVAELSDDLLDVLTAPPLRWGFVLVDDETELQRVLDPFEPNFAAEIARREEACPPTRWSSSLGFGTTAGKRTSDRQLWGLWTFGKPSPDLRHLASVLLAQEAPVGVRITVTPAELNTDERSGIEQLVMEVGPGLPNEGLLRASLATLEAFLYLRPLFSLRCVVASPEQVSRSMLSAIGHTISDPASHGSAGKPVLEGGFVALRGDKNLDGGILREAWTSLVDARTLPSLAQAGLERLRQTFGVQEAAHAFRFPVTDDDFPGLRTLRIPDLDPPVADMPRTGRSLGRLVSHGRRPVLIDPEERFRHLYVSGQTGTGKSTLLLNLALQDIKAGAGVAVIDPHGDLVEALLGCIPPDRIDDIVLVDPADPVAVVGVNLLEAETPIQEEYVVSELCAMFYALFDPHRQGIVGPRFETMLRQAALLLLAHPDQPSSMLDIGTLFVDQAVRTHLVDGLDDPILSEFWLGEMQMSRSNEWQEVVSWFRSKFEIFRTSRLVRNVVGQAESTVSFADVLRERRILLVNLSKGLLGEYNSALIGHIVFSRLWAAALERASVSSDERPDFFIYVDEFQNITSESLPNVLSEARKFRVGVTLANQFFSQVPELTRDSIMGNVGARITFRVGPKDAHLFSDWLGRQVTIDDLTGLPNYVAIGALTDRGVPLDPLVLRTDPPMEQYDEVQADRARKASRSNWARPVEDLDKAFFTRWSHVKGSLSASLAAKNRTMSRPDPAGPILDSWLAKQKKT